MLYCTRLRPNNYVLVQHKIKIAKRPPPLDLQYTVIICNHYDILILTKILTPPPPPIKEMMILLSPER